MSKGIGSDMFRLTIQISVKFERYWVKNMQQPVDPYTMGYGSNLLARLPSRLTAYKLVQKRAPSR
ncbi:16363_t:CDS:2 [Funneliformis caledonium]|uniref:16363_t:CDS:1 n=1 Tax=Funneliformis caledonium TaxID=1117310 RepID=A0A9N9DNC7_9GLOM|nr:16363_t:CDS:2 [Funneliformis caledonium]